MPSAGDGGAFQDPAARNIVWASERERFAAIAAGVRVIKTGRGYQVQVLDELPGGGVRVAAVTPGDARHWDLYQTLITPESDWGKDEEDD